MGFRWDSHVVLSICHALCEKATTHGVTARSTLATSAAIHAACAASCCADMVHVSAVKAIQWTSGVSKEYQKLLGEPELAAAFSVTAW